MTAVSQVPLVGRDGELPVLRSLVAAAAAGRGGALVVTGAPGIGKSVLLDAAAQEAADAGARVLRASGVEFEADIAFSSLNQLVLPLSQTIRALEPRRGEVLSVAFGFDDAAVVERVAVADATVALVRRAAAARAASACCRRRHVAGPLERVRPELRRAPFGGEPGGADRHLQAARRQLLRPCRPVGTRARTARRRRG